MPSKNSFKILWPDLRNILILASLITVCFLPLFNAKLLYWDDNRHVFENPLVQTRDFAGLVQIFQSTVNETYIPLTVLSFNLEHRFFGFNPFVYHLDNLILHIMVCALIYVLALCLGLETIAAFLAALLFGIHPMHVESVAWVTERKDVLYSVFYLLGLIQYCRYIRTNDKKALLWFIGAGFLSILAKPMALSFPLALLLLDWFLKRQFSMNIFLEKIPFLLFIPIVWLTYSLNILPNTSTPFESGLIWIWTFSFYLIKFFLPVGLSPLYTLPYPISLGNPEYLIAFLIAAAVLFVVIKFRNNRWVIFAALYYLLSIFFLLRLTDVSKNLGPSIVADRFMYLPSLGICLWLAKILADKINTQQSQKRFVIRALFVVVIIFAVKTSSQCLIWKDDLTLWNYVLEDGREIALALNSRGAALSKQGEQKRALEDINKALQLNPQYAMAYYNRGKIYAGLGDTGRALENFNACINAKPKHARAHSERGIIYSKQNRSEEALKDFDEAIRLNPADADFYNNRGIAYKKMKQWDKALKDYGHALALKPRSAQTYVNRSSIWKELKRYNEAFQDMQKAKELGFPVDPHYLQELRTLSSQNP